MEQPLIASEERVSSWPPIYQLRKSKRAKRLQLKITPEKGLEIVVPYRFGKFDVPAFLAEHQDWIIKNLKNYPRQPAKDKLPCWLPLRALDEIWCVEYLEENRSHFKVKPDSENRQLFIYGEIADEGQVRQRLRKWLSNHAKQFLLPRLQQLSLQTGLQYQKATIRNQRTCWGSCSATGNISLNCQLLFLPPRLATHIMLHELCHTRYLNHSKQFWQLLGSFDPDWQHHKRAFQQAGERYVPAWFKSA